MKRFFKVTLYILVLIVSGLILGFFFTMKSHTYEKNCNFNPKSEYVTNPTCAPGDSNFYAALKIVAEFEKKKDESSAFPGIPKNIIIRQLRERIANPETLYQGHGGRNLCGPAAVAYCYLNYNPAGYAKTIIDLYLTGWANCVGQTIKTNSIIRSTGMKDANYVADVKVSKLFAVDFILMSALRYTENDGVCSIFTFHVQSNVPFVNGTWPHEIEDLLAMVGLETICGRFYKHSGLTPINGAYTEDDIKKIENALKGNYLVIIFIDYTRFNGLPLSWFNSNFGNHFIVAHDFVKFKDRKFAFKYWEFAKANKITKKYSIEDFNANIKGYWIVGRKI
jgi:hypothetical protein